MRKDLIQKLSILKELKPDSSWKESNRNLLLLQVKSSGSQTDAKSGFFGFLEKNYTMVWIHGLSHSAIFTFVLVFIFLGSGIFSLQASKNSKPGDSFYIAKRLNEKAQLAIAFSDEQKARLGLEFASNRVKELKAVLSEPKTEKNQAEVVKLVKDFKEKIKIAKTGIVKQPDLIEVKPVLDTVKKVAIKKETIKTVGKEGKKNEEDEEMFSAGLKKENRGIQVSAPEKPQVENKASEIVSASSSKEIEKTEVEMSKGIDELMAQTESLLSTKDGVDLKSLDALEAKVVEVSGGDGKEATSTEKGK